MLTVEFTGGEWQSPRIVPYGPLAVSPANSALHYGQAIFEGMKAYRQADGGVALFRPLDNWQRLNTSAERMAMPPVPEDIFMQGLRELVKLDAAWVPGAPGSSLYIRPFMFATDGFLGVRPSNTYHFVHYYLPGRRRTSRSRCGLAFRAAVRARRPRRGRLRQKRRQLRRPPCCLPAWPSSKATTSCSGPMPPAHQYIEESGTMNVAFILNNKLVTPAVSSSILDGITRRSVLQLARDWGLPVEERQVSSREVMDALAAGTAPGSVWHWHGRDHRAHRHPRLRRPGPRPARPDRGQLLTPGRAWPWRPSAPATPPTRTAGWWR
ncbi:MAG: aminotransferase class IV [Hymenobacter sp.]